METDFGGRCTSSGQYGPKSFRYNATSVMLSRNDNAQRRRIRLTKKRDVRVDMLLPFEAIHLACLQNSSFSSLLVVGPTLSEEDQVLKILTQMMGTRNVLANVQRPARIHRHTRRTNVS